MNLRITIIVLSLTAATFTSCKNDDDDQPSSENINQAVMTEFASNIAYTSYVNLANQTTQLHQKTQTFRANPTASGLEECRNAWKSSRSVWEQTESFLFGPVATDNIDPRIDTWPVNFNDLEIIMSNGAVLDENYINGLDDALKGFHPVEYLLFGIGGTKVYTDFTARELEYLEGLTQNLKTLTGNLSTSWSPAASNSYYYSFTNAGNGSSVYASQKSAFEELVNAMAGICDEVAEGKMNEPFVAQNPELEESPFSGNSIIDFTNNIKGVQNMYLGKNIVDGKGLEDIVRQHNLSLDGLIKTKIANAISSLNAITDPFGTAITTQPIQVQNAIDAINELKVVLEEDLYSYILVHI
jgi:predicted lipoprotein